MLRREITFNNHMFSKKADTKTGGTLITSRIYLNPIYCLHHFSHQFRIIRDKNMDVGRICMLSVTYQILCKNKGIK